MEGIKETGAPTDTQRNSGRLGSMHRAYIGLGQMGYLCWGGKQTQASIPNSESIPNWSTLTDKISFLQLSLTWDTNHSQVQDTCQAVVGQHKNEQNGIFRVSLSQVFLNTIALSIFINLNTNTSCQHTLTHHFSHSIQFIYPIVKD